MREYFPLLFVGGIVGVAATVFLLAYYMMKAKKEAAEFDRTMSDRELIRRLLAYAVAAAFSGRIGARVEMACL